jgi:hypothetical protein
LIHATLRLFPSSSVSHTIKPAKSATAVVAGPATSAPPVATMPSRLTAPYFVIGSWKRLNAIAAPRSATNIAV